MKKARDQAPANNKFQKLLQAWRILVEKLNLVKRHTKPGRVSQQGGILERENPLDVSNVLVVCAKCDKAVRTGRSFLADGRKVRVCKGCGEIID